MILAPIVEIFWDIDDFYKQHAKALRARVFPMAEKNANAKQT